jgi:hypothetical protein
MVNALGRPMLLSLAHHASTRLPPRVLRQLAGQALSGLHAALCLHRVARARRATDWLPMLTVHPDDLDTAIDLLLSSRRGPRERWLTVTFDDGYADAAEYIDARAARFPDVQFALFVCPEKLETRAGFRWDLIERRLAAGMERGAALALLDAPMDASTENQREDLRELGDAPDFRLATVEAVQALRRWPNVLVGNHTNTHARPRSLSAEAMRDEWQRSRAAFTRRFGAPVESAFPFGTPRADFEPRHVEAFHAVHAGGLLWTTEGRPYRPEERRPGAVLPRFAVDGRLSGPAMVAWMAARAVAWRWR